MADNLDNDTGTITDKGGAKAKNPKTDQASGNTLVGNAPDGLTLSAADAKEARTEGAKEAAKESAKESYQYLTDGNLPGEQPATNYVGMSDIMLYEHFLTLDIEDFKKAVDGKPKDDSLPLGEEKVAGLLSLERSGKNRTDYVQAMMKRLDVKSPYEVTHAGPAYTNDVVATRTTF